MKLFISWSGKRSKHIALAFRQWLPTVIQGLKPWMSELDIEKGSEWNQVLTEELEGTPFGLFCLTPESRSSLWLFFEAGAIAKRQGTKRVYTYLFDLDYSDVPWPLAQFQPTKATKADTFKMLADMNKHLKEPLESAVLQKAFNRGWPELDDTFTTIPKEDGVPDHKTKTEMILEEILAHVRLQSRRITAPRPEETALHNLGSLIDFWRIDTEEDAQRLVESIKRIKSIGEPPMPRKKTPPKD